MSKIGTDENAVRRVTAGLDEAAADFAYLTPAVPTSTTYGFVRRMLEAQGRIQSLAGRLSEVIEQDADKVTAVHQGLMDNDQALANTFRMDRA
ncbi:MAG: hypothetical protein LBJ02_07260 [Bifidobacteriaceae bacterium]|nr:hypothetical protein [Bifidobacteriaceae bacterium]